MATPASVINSALSLLERPDMRQKAEDCFYSALKQAHAFKFGRDIQTVTINSISRSGDLASVATPARLKEILSITTPSLATSNPSAQFKSSFGTPTINDYFGYQYPYSYSLSGTNISLRGIPAQDTQLSITGLFWPTFYLATPPNTYASDSWILLEYKDLVTAYLFSELSLFQSDDKKKASAAKYLQNHLNIFSSTYSHEYL